MKNEPKEASRKLEPTEAAAPHSSPEREIPDPKTPLRPVRSGPGVWRRAFRWLLALLIFFALGALVITWAFYLPLRQRTEGRFSDLQAAQQQIDQLEQDLAAEQARSEQSAALQSELDQAEAHIGLLKARLDVAAAQLALAQKDNAKARVALSQTARTLDELAAGRDEDQRQVIADLKTRINLVRDEIGQNDFAAQSDLDVLAAGLLELESAVIR